jgi:hypothetical protein
LEDQVKDGNTAINWIPGKYAQMMYFNIPAWILNYIVVHE